MPLPLPTSLSGYYNRFDPALRYDEILIRAQRGAQSAELNEIQSTFIDRLKRVADAVFRDGYVITGTPPTITNTTITCPLSAIYLRGAVRDVPARSFTIALTGLVRVGIYLLDEVVTEIEDPNLRCPAPQTRNYNEPGAARLRTTATWGREGDGSTGVFYPVWTVIDGALLNQAGGSGGTDAFSEALARYDRESNGNYIVDGLTVTALGLTGGVNAFSIRAGVGNIFGYKVDKPTATRLLYTEDPDLELVDAEPDTFTGTTGGSATIQLNRAPLDAILEVVITKERTVNITRGGFTGGQDTLPDVSVLSIQSITQGGTTYHSPQDYFLNGDTVDWSPAGGGATEPAPGSTYTITYRYLSNATPTAVNLQSGTFTIAGAVNGTLVLTDYRWKLPRFDRICIDRDGNFQRVKGLPSRFTALPPAVASNLLPLATIQQRWGLTPEVENDGIRAIPFDQLERLRSLVVGLYDLVAIERLRNDVSSREPSSKRGVFVDPFLDDDLRDQGIAQTAAIVNGTLRLPIAPTVYRPSTNNSQDWLLPYTEQVILEQPRFTGSSPINPYQAFDPIPAAFTLTPAVDRWTEFETVWSSPVTEAISIRLGGARRFSSTSTVTERTELLSENQRPVQFLRQIQVGFVIDGFDPGETLTLLEFDGINVTPLSLNANSAGIIAGTFTIPARVPIGTKRVRAIGGQGSFAATRFIGEGAIVTSTLRQITTIETRFWDPLAQTFRLDAARYVTAVDLRFTARGSTSNQVVIEIRETELGLPNAVTLAEGILQGSSITANAWNKISLTRPVYLQAGVEYAIVILTDDPTHAVALAELGKFDQAANQFVTSQPYTIGTLLKSSNASTWTPVQESDLAFRIYAASFTSMTRTVALGTLQIGGATITRSGGTATAVLPGHGRITGHSVAITGADQSEYNGVKVITVTGPDTFTFAVSGSPASPATGTISVSQAKVTDLVTLAGVDRVSSATDVEFVFTTAGGTQIRGSDNARIQLAEEVNEPLNLSAILRGTTTESPYLFANSQAVLGDLSESGNYVSRAVPCAAGARVTVTFEALIPGASSVVVEVQKGDGTWQAVSLTTSAPVGDGWIEQIHTIAAFAAGGTQTSTRLTLSGTAAARPEVRQLRMVVI